MDDMTETTQDAYVKGYNQGRADEAAQAMTHHFPSAANQGAGLFKTPDITPAQAVAVVGALLAVAASFGFDLSQQQQDSVMQLVSIVAGVLLAGDAVIRHGRATGNAKKVD
jgi:hypothetical protein